MKFASRLAPLVARTIDTIVERWDTWQHKEEGSEPDGAANVNGSSTRPARKSTIRPTRRHHLRKDTNYPIEFALPDGAPRTGICRDLSFHGLRIETVDPAPVDVSVIVFIELVGIEGTTALSGVVRWATPEAMGVQLDPFGTDITRAIIRMIADDDG
jgi:hypothetical protein